MIKNRWRDVLSAHRQKIAEKPEDVSVIVEAIYFLVDLILEGQRENRFDFVLEADEVAGEIKDLFDKSSKRFNEEAEYLFFVGYLMTLMAWYFGESILETARQMSKRATEIEPDNILFRWAYSNEMATKGELAEKVLSDPEKIDWLKSRGAAGKYMTDMLRTSLNRL